jgi:hypothetical protein
MAEAPLINAKNQFRGPGPLHNSAFANFHYKMLATITGVSFAIHALVANIRAWRRARNIQAVNAQGSTAHPL